jgi:ATP-dependent 26S proteasome regulatory subunit
VSARTATADPRRELELLLTSRYALIVVESREEARVLDLVRQASLKVRQAREWGVFQWTATEGLNRLDRAGSAPNRSLAEPAQVLRHLRATPAAGIYVLVDFHPFLADPMHVRLLKDIAQGYAQVPRTVVLLSHELAVPAELEHLAAHLHLALPGVDERRMTLARIAREWAAAHPGRTVSSDRESVERLVENLAGLAQPDVERLARAAVYDDGAITPEDLPRVQAAKVELLNRSGTLGFEPDTARFADIGGMRNVAAWLERRRPAFTAGAAGTRAAALDAPKGMLLLGVQGCGKSLAARGAAGLLGVPLLRLDFAALYTKWHGESEKNLRESLKTAESLAPCVLWVDEIEKALAGGDADGGVSRRVLGTFLTWLAEQRSRIFVVATANDISALPPELVRKGRFDEIFFVDLPDAAARAAILGVHARRRAVQLTDRELAALAARAEGFSGAELEQAIVAALYAAHAEDRAITAADVAAEIAATRPLSVVMGEQVQALREWARGRTVPAD